jgi:hypothetical protein
MTRSWFSGNCLPVLGVSLLITNALVASPQEMPLQANEREQRFNTIVKCLLGALPADSACRIADHPVKKIAELLPWSLTDAQPKDKAA